MSIFLGYIFLGISLAAPIGPINAAQLDKGIKNGFFHAWLVGLGAMTADAVYMLAVYLGVVNFLEIPFMKAFLWCFGFFVLIYTGIKSLLSAGKVISSYRGKGESSIKSFMSGFLISLSNPLTILFWLGIYGSVLAKTAAEYDKAHVILYSGAIFIGLLLWDLTMAGVASSFRRFLTGKILAFISILSGFSLIGFGIYFGVEAYKLLF
ncbi:LysE family translocator [Cytobacillus sp. NCCP-133]|uniref:LysE family translocator n=1 Tax=Cytobacillus sp. NCCP-133 TaxID=766848 RepID=UPI0022323281|nr:LysE family translocator [Cytobacillus sp. NCCP-133]GLB59415.1 amino acid transporter [Cytobacillus sp. NCCP-133]